MNYREKKRKKLNIGKKIKKLLKLIFSPILHDKSLDQIDVEIFVDILYPIGLSLILAFSVHKISDISSIKLSLFVFLRILTITLLILYILFDWDDCHHAINADKNHITSSDRIFWLFAIFYLSLLTVLILIHPDNSTNALVGWLFYAGFSALFRDKLIYKKSANYKKYRPYKDIFCCLFILTAFLGLAHIIDVIDLRRILYKTLNIDFTVSTGDTILLLSMLVSIILALILKNQRKKMVFGISKLAPKDTAPVEGSIT